MGKESAGGGRNYRAKGTHYEDVACEFLEKQGYRITHRNFRSHFGEIDIIARDGRYLVFIEVKYRKDASAGSPAEAVTPYKQKRISQTAAFFITRYQVPLDTPMRFDVVAITPEGIMLYKNAFDYCM